MNRSLRARGPIRWLVQASTFVRKELIEIIRQPRLLITLVFGPFLLLMVFGNSYRQDTSQMRTIFVGPQGGVYERAIENYRGTLEQYVSVTGLTSDRAAAERELSHGNVDLVVVFPSDALDRIESGEQAIVLVLNDKLDPVQNSAVEIAARLAVQELNASIISSVIDSAQNGDVPVDRLLDDSLAATTRLTDAASAGDPAAIRTSADEATAEIDRLRSGSRAATAMLDEIGNIPDRDRATTAQIDDSLDAIATKLSEVRDASNDAALARQRADEINTAVGELRPRLMSLVTMDPTVLSRPFVAQTHTVLPHTVDVTSFFAPSSIALLLQHLALSFAALAIVRDRALGLIEIIRTGTTSLLAILAGRFIAFTAAGSAVGAALLFAVHRFLDVPMVGSLVWAWIAVVVLLLASIALGMVVALVSGSDSQVVQYAMLVLLASLFFGGFVLDLGQINYPGRMISWLLPVTFAIKMLQYAMLRGVTPRTEDLLALVGQLAVYATVAAVLFRRSVRVS